MQGFSILMIFGACFGLVITDVPDKGFQLDRCLGKHGVLLPVIGNCHQYLTCVQGEAIISSCGEYHFNAHLAVCDLPENAGCISFEPLPTKPVQQPPPKPVGNLCVGIANGVFLPVAENARQYYLCMNNKAFLKDCGKLYFNAKHSACAPFPDDGTPIKEKIRPSQKIENSVILPLQKLPGQYATLDDGIPPQKFENSVLLPPQKLPEQYATLHEGIPIKEEVQPPQKFENSVLLPLQKMRSQYATLDEGIPTKPEVKPPQELPDQSNSLALELCQNQPFGARVPVRDSCNQYYICMGKIAIPESCGQMQFNPWTRICDLPTNVLCHVENYKAVYHKTEQLMRPSSQNSSSIDTSVCHGQRDGIFLAVPGKCSEFYFCFKNQGFLKTCGHRHFSPITLSCVDLEASNCVEFRQPPQTPQPPQTEEQSKSNQAAETLEASCLNRNNGIFLRHPLDCGKFIMCDNHVAVEMNCPAGLHFNTEKNYCDWPEMAKCFLNN